MNTQGKKRIALRDQYRLETGLISYGHLGKYADWLEKKLANKCVRESISKKYDNFIYHMNELKVSLDEYTELHRFDD